MIGLWINFIDIDPIKALVYTAVINGVIAVPILFAVMKIANDKKVLRDNTNNRVSNVIGWLTFVIMGVSVIIMLVTWGAGRCVDCIPAVRYRRTVKCGVVSLWHS